MNASVRPLPGDQMIDDPDGTLTEQAYVEAIRHAIANHPRSLQRAIGPSEVGIECDRRLAYKLLGHPERDGGDGWLPTVGTGVHSWLEERSTTPPTATWSPDHPTRSAG